MSEDDDLKPKTPLAGAGPDWSEPRAEGVGPDQTGPEAPPVTGGSGADLPDVPVDDPLSDAVPEGAGEPTSPPLRHRLGSLFRRKPARAELSPTEGGVPDDGASDAGHPEMGDLASAAADGGSGAGHEAAAPEDLSGPVEEKRRRGLLGALFGKRARGDMAPVEGADLSDIASDGVILVKQDTTSDVVIPKEIRSDQPGGAIARITKKGAGGRGSDGRGFPPIQVIIGWIGESSRKDVLEHARGFAADHIESLGTAWIAMADFQGGTLFEIHEGGAGLSYLPDLIEGIGRDPDQVLWVPSGTRLNRVLTFSIVEAKPFSMILNEKDSVRVRASGQAPVDRNGKMRRLVPRGTPVLVVGVTLFSIALTSLAASAFLSARINQQPIPSLTFNAETLPHGQIVTLSNALREDRWVSRILFENGTWRAEFETFDDLVLPEDDGEAQQMINETVERDQVLQEERERKMRGLGEE